MSSVRSNWLEQALPDGRKYWYNMSTTQSVWEEPAELAAGRDRTALVPSRPKAANSDIVSSWREMTSASGRKYYYNAVTKVSMWEIPPDYAEYLERMKDPATMDKDILEGKFMAMLKETGITSKHSWEEALRQVINHPHYKLVPTLAERKLLFTRYVEVQREVEREERVQKAIRDREEFRALLRATKAITPTTRYNEVIEILEKEPAFQAIDNSKERANLFDDYISDLRREEGEKARQRKRRAADKFQQLLASLSDIKVDTLWKVAREIFTNCPTFVKDEDLTKMEPMEQLLGYENYIKHLERTEQQREAELRDSQHRQERLNRQAFRKMLNELEEKGLLTATTSWMEIYPLVKGRSELVAMLSQSGSTPLDFYWDHLHRLQERYTSEAKIVIEKLSQRYGEDWLSCLTLEALKEVIEGSGIPTSSIGSFRRHFFPLKPSLVNSNIISAEEKARIAIKVDTCRREKRKQIDKLKHAIKHFSPPIVLDSTFAEFGPLLAANPDISAVEDVEIQRYYFEKYIRHLRKKAGLEVEKSDEEDGGVGGGILAQEGQVLKRDELPDDHHRHHHHHRVPPNVTRRSTNK